MPGGCPEGDHHFKCVSKDGRGFYGGSYHQNIAASSVLSGMLLQKFIQKCKFKISGSIGHNKLN